MLLLPVMMGLFWCFGLLVCLEFRDKPVKGSLGPAPNNRHSTASAIVGSRFARWCGWLLINAGRSSSDSGLSIIFDATGGFRKDNFVADAFAIAGAVLVAAARQRDQGARSTELWAAAFATVLLVTIQRTVWWEHGHDKNFESKYYFMRGQHEAHEGRAQEESNVEAL